MINIKSAFSQPQGMKHSQSYSNLNKQIGSQQLKRNGSQEDLRFNSTLFNRQNSIKTQASATHQQSVSIETLSSVESFSSELSESMNEVQNIVSSDKVVLFCKNSCPSCKDAKRLLDKYRCKYTAINLDTLGQVGLNLHKALVEITGKKTVPGIFLNGNFIGGYSDGLLPMYQRRFLEPYLKQINALQVRVPVS